MQNDQKTHRGDQTDLGDQTDDKTCARDARLLAHLIKYTYCWNAHVNLANTGKKITKTAKIYGHVVLKGDRTIV